GPGHRAHAVQRTRSRLRRTLQLETHRPVLGDSGSGEPSVRIAGAIPACAKTAEAGGARFCSVLPNAVPEYTSGRRTALNMDRGSPFLLCPSDSVVKERHSALPSRRLQCNEPKAPCPGPFRLSQTAAGTAESNANHLRLLTARNGPGQPRMALAKPSEASATPESTCSSHPKLVATRNPAAQAGMTF